MVPDPDGCWNWSSYAWKKYITKRMKWNKPSRYDFTLPRNEKSFSGSTIPQKLTSSALDYESRLRGFRNDNEKKRFEPKLPLQPDFPKTTAPSSWSPWLLTAFSWSLLGDAIEFILYFVKKCFVILLILPTIQQCSICAKKKNVKHPVERTIYPLACRYTPRGV